MPSVVIVIPDQALRQLFQYAFDVAGWSTNVAHSPIDALALAFNAEADRIVTSTAGGSANDLLTSLAEDEVLRETPCSILVPIESVREGEAGVSVTEFAMPCDPYWLIVDADRQIGRDTKPGLGRRPVSDEPCDLALFAWWWTLAAFHLVRDAIALDMAEVAERLARRTGTTITVKSDVPDASDLAAWNPSAQRTSWRIQVRTSWWLVEAEPGDLTAQSVSCIGAVAGALRLARR